MADKLVEEFYKNYDCKNSVRFDCNRGNMGALNAVYIRNEELAKIGGSDVAKVRVTIERID
jgi:hypothetical protein